MKAPTPAMANCASESCPAHPVTTTSDRPTSATEAEVATATAGLAPRCDTNASTARSTGITSAQRQRATSKEKDRHDREERDSRRPRGALDVARHLGLRHTDRKSAGERPPE